MRELISLHVGQCGNQVGIEFLKMLCNQHNIDPLGNAKSATSSSNERKDIFFREDDSGRFVPRSILIDTEPRVLDRISKGQIQGLLDPENMVMPQKEGSGSGNNWMKGYEFGEMYDEQIVDVIVREARHCDSLEGFLLLHSTAGGTGSGVGSRILERLSDCFPTKVIQTYTVFPHNKKDAADTTVQPYNTILTLRKLIEHASAVVVLDNDALNNIAQNTLRVENPQMEHINQFVSTVMDLSTSTLRFPGYTHNTLEGIIASLCPFPRNQFLMCSCAPLMTQATQQQHLRSTQVGEIMERLLNRENRLVSYVNTSGSGYYLSALDVLRGRSEEDVNGRQLMGAYRRIWDQKLITFAPWLSSSLEVAVTTKSPHVVQQNKVTGLMIANHTGIAALMKNFQSQFDKMYKQGSFLHMFEGVKLFEGTAKAEFDEAREVVQSTVDEYKQMEKPDFVSW
ncbi:MAG: putative Tubulin gamma chain [Streblomastix strix]|uniref:Tubulin gamma chain n=1 Tax=Streblomastix strix TaxID=222440 RepID=A0A5J4W230_9EUKA|nr:MAG: putative Tubulin gamma chain [Streblomastix strix]